MFKDRHIKKFKRVIKLISMNRRLFWFHLEVHEVDQGAVHVHHDPHVPHVQGQEHGEVQESHKEKDNGTSKTTTPAEKRSKEK
jgi:hypothetical protein